MFRLMERKTKMKDKKTVLSLSWRDIRSCRAGGAEVHTHELLKAIDSDQYEIYHISMYERGLPRVEDIDGIHYLRGGKILGILFHAFIYYVRHRKEICIVIDQCNTFRFFTKFWVNKKKRVFYIHQLTREIWDIQLGGILAKLGKRLESPMLRLNKNDYTITVSESTKEELLELGFKKEKITIIPNGLPQQIYRKSKESVKEQRLTFVYVGRYAKYKGIDDCIAAFGEFKRKYSGAQLWIVGKKDQKYLDSVLIPICKSYRLTYGETIGSNVVFWGFVSEERKYELMQRAHALICPSIREGWGIIISEAGYLGTPSIVYNSPGLRDAVDYGKAGYLCKANTPTELLVHMEGVYNDPEQYRQYQAAAQELAGKLKWENNRRVINELIDRIVDEQKED